ncbi:MAG: (2Fe-2S)-binding protein [Bryobacteraceae bacterium]
MATKADVGEGIVVRTLADSTISLKVNGREHTESVATDLLLVDLLRDRLGLTGTKFGCDTGHCGSCTVLVDGLSVKSCTMLAVQADGANLTTIEGVSEGGVLNALQSAFWEQHAVQCGYCTPGMVLSLTDLLSRNSQPSQSEIRHWIDGNVCRCGVYQNVVRAVESLISTSR